jgi:hypothetical protein
MVKYFPKEARKKLIGPNVFVVIIKLLDKHVEICHRKAISEFPKDTLIIEVNNRNNVLFLCPNCHWEFDNK